MITLREVTYCYRFGCWNTSIKRQAETGAEVDLRNKIRSHAARLSMWDAPNNEDSWRLFLTHLTGNRIQWRLPWVYGRALLRTNHAYFIELIGLEGFQPYAPLRVLRQFGITQGIPLWSNMALVEEFSRGPAVMGFWLTDSQRSNQIGTELFNLMHITTTMYHQVIPRSVDHLIQAVDDEPNEEMEEDPEEDPREPTEEMEEDSEGYSEHDPNLYDPRDGGVMHMENEPVPIVEDANSEYGFIGFDEREDSNNWEWKIDESLEYHREPYYDGDDNGDDAPIWP
ncbi:hypothetical protein KY285_023513 [Solanum tuberosum]|nr:hypothetical protein KY289_023848 [Solanum tuberosum]KAH0675712.1 hypothetical protein KY285_023513 [Solanum tuberosum]